MDRREQAALLLALRDSGRSWTDVTTAVEDAGSAVAMLDLSGPELIRRLELVEQEIESWTDEGIRLITVLDEQYPVQLLMVHQRPPFLTWRGPLELLGGTGVAVVGGRCPSARGAQTTREIVTALVGHGVTVYSGLATARLAAVEAGGRAVSVAGAGLRHCPEEAGLSRTTSAVLSPFWPDADPSSCQAAVRDAVMSGCCVATVVVEADEHTRRLVRLALEHGRHVFLAPEVASGTTWGREPNTTVLEAPGHLVRVLDELCAETPDLIDL
ncbi:DNA processing protein [Lentzea fradiae]|uniref:DNA processing protein n=1 Tax=Lentzea fradiae TaxID=200378 RepID=A0A1G7LZV1_9PSEU|nr:DNA-processing protein DprA [Lentzea fradiae]SDF54916.1 DNA processing protein [Lentzea fradiae]